MKRCVAVGVLWTAVVILVPGCACGKHVTQVEHPPAPVNPKEMEAAWSPDGTQIAYYRLAAFLGDSSGICVMHADGSERRHLVEGMLPAWSPDGTELAFVRGAQVCVIELRDGSIRQLTQTGRNFFPSWSPDGHRLAFDRTTPSDSAGIWLCDASDGGRKTRVLDHGREPFWSPDGTRLVFSWFAGTGLEDLCVLRLDDGHVEQLTATPHTTELRPTWSRDGRWIAYGSERGIGVYSVADGRYGLIPGTQQPGLATYHLAAIGPDSRTILYNKEHLWTVEVDGTENRPLARTSK